MRSFVIMMMLAFLFGCGNNSTEQKKEEYAEKNESELTIQLTAEQRAQAKIATAPAAIQTFSGTLQIPGRIDFNQQQLAHITARVSGRVEAVFAFAGDRVQANEVLATIYSQQYLAAQSEFLQAKQRLAHIEMKNDTGEIQTARAIFESARQKLIVLGVSQNEIAELEQTQTQKTMLEIRSPFNGSVIDANEILGHFVEVGTNLFHIANLSTVWIIADVNEKDIAQLKTGLHASVEVSAYPGELFEGRVTRIFDVLDEKTHTVKVRIEAKNLQGKLKPQMFASVTLALEEGTRALMIPKEAVQLEGNEQIVFVAGANNIFTKQIVKTGRELGKNIEITEGLHAGDTVVTEGAFTIKSEFQKSELSGE
ncbi:MAG: efflux RND transporter periplasmic adaptor subunit [Bacteroidetes bacterium]|nr:efflux RND transporter periplasmic adaptor subunit [Bacteroidota bacterium]